MSFIEPIFESSAEQFKKPSNIQTNHEMLLKKSNSLNFETSIPLKKSHEEFNQNLNPNLNKPKPEPLITQSSSDNNKNNNTTIKQPEEQKQDLIKLKKKPANIDSLEAWLVNEGPGLLQESLKKLKLDENQIHKTSMEGLGVGELEDKKKMVKNELKRYDFTFDGIFNRPPIRNEKEPMRPLYIYYKLIKQSLMKEQGDRSQQSQGSSNHTTNNKEIKNSYSNNRTENYQKSKSFEIPNVESNKMERPMKFSINDLKKKLDELKKTKNELRNKLHNYQQNFTKDNNRKIKYHKDISPVEDDYKRYKELKTEIQKLEEIVNSGSSRGSAGN